VRRTLLGEGEENTSGGGRDGQGSHWLGSVSFCQRWHGFGLKGGWVEDIGMAAA